MQGICMTKRDEPRQQAALGDSRTHQSGRPTQRMAQQTAMIVDDQPLIAAMLGQLLFAQAACQTTLITSEVAELLRATEQGAPDLVLMDAGMAGAFRAIRALITHQPHVRVVLLDEFPSELNLRRAVDCGVSGYCAKSAAPAEFLAAIHTVLGGGVVLPEPLPTGTKAVTAGAHVDGAQKLALLTRREIEVLTRLAAGSRVAECARLLGISPNTVENHKAHIMRKLGLHKNVELARFAIRHGLVTDE